MAKSKSVTALPMPVPVTAPEPRKGGAPSKRIPARREVILKALRNGHSAEHAALLAGISYANLKDWRNTDADFDQACELSRAEMAEKMLGYIEDAAPRSWQAAAWKLEKVLPQLYGKARVEITGADGGAIQTESINKKLDSLSIEELRAIAQRTTE